MRRWVLDTRVALALGVAFAVAPMGCTDRSLSRVPGLGEGPADNKLAVRGQFCTEDPTTLSFPVKILFVVDSSQSMDTTDPTGRRLSAVREVVDAFIDDPGVSFGIIQFAGATNVLTQDPVAMADGFTRDRAELESAIVNLGRAGETTDYEGALANVVRVLSRDMMDSDEVELSRAKYVVIFLSDGLPNPVRPPTNTRASILERIDEILELQRVFRPAEIRFHSALVLGAIATGFRCTDSGLEGGVGNCQVQPTAADCALEPGCVWVGVEQEAESLLTAMSEAGQGTFTSFRNGEEINFLRIDFTSIRRVFTLKNLVVSNVNTRPTLTFLNANDRIGLATGDSDGDGLDDDTENRVGSDVLSADSDGDGFHDFLEVRLSASGFDPLDPSDADCALELDRIDTDGDGLLDCEERFVGTSRNFVDSDADGFPDTIELRYGTNPVSDDSLVDLDFDGARNGDELRGHSDPVVNDAANRSGVAYRYEVIEQRLEAVDPNSEAAMAMQAGQACYTFRVENVTLVETENNGNNRVLLYVAQAPFDDPTDRGVFRVACVEQRFLFPDFRDPPYAEVEIPSSAFVSPTAFDPDVDCTTGSPP